MAHPVGMKQGIATLVAIGALATADCAAAAVPTRELLLRCDFKGEDIGRRMSAELSRVPISGRRNYRFHIKGDELVAYDAWDGGWRQQQCFGDRNSCSLSPSGIEIKYLEYSTFEFKDVRYLVWMRGDISIDLSKGDYQVTMVAYEYDANQTDTAAPPTEDSFEDDGRVFGESRKGTCKPSAAPE